MITNRDKRKHRKHTSGRIKMVDDKTGFHMYSDDMSVEWDGIVTHIKNYDPPYGDEMPYTIPDDSLPPPFIDLRPPGTDQFKSTSQTESDIRAEEDNL